MQQPAGVVVRPAIKHVPRSVVRDAHERIVRCALVIVPVDSETEDKFEDAMEVTASSPLFEIAFVLVRFDHVASFMINANHSIMRAAVELCVGNTKAMIAEGAIEHRDAMRCTLNNSFIPPGAVLGWVEVAVLAQPSASASPWAWKPVQAAKRCRLQS